MSTSLVIWACPTAQISASGAPGADAPKKVLFMEDGTFSAPAPYIAPGAYYNPVSDRIKPSK
ncbi:MAG: hypothetical protein IPI18_09930 [Saprospiraceae bacterium]|nr:hypothetical protein [Saprospiraceae bacterium]